jgi:hypothetical protein
MQSWFAQNGVAPGHSAKRNAPSGIPSHPSQSIHSFHQNLQPLSTEHFKANINAKNATKNNIANPIYRYIQQSSSGRSNDANLNIGTYTADHSFPMQRSNGSTLAPTKIVQCEAENVQMSQLSHDSSAYESHFSHDTQRFQLAPPQGCYRSSSYTTRGILPLHTNRSYSSTSSKQSRTDHPAPTSEVDKPWLYNSLPSSTTSVPLMSNPSRNSFMGRRQPPIRSQMNMEHVHKIASMNSNNTSQDSQYTYNVLSNATTTSGIPRFQSTDQGLSQSSHSIPNSQTVQSYMQDERYIHALIDGHVEAALKERLEPKIKEFDDRQLLFHRRITEAEEKHTDCINEVDHKHKECMKQIHKLGKQSEKFNQKVSDVVRTITKCNVDMEKQSNEFQAKGLYLETMYGKVTEMIDSVESATSSLKAIVKSSISSIKQAHDVAMESTLYVLKKKATDIINVVLSDLGCNFRPLEEVTNSATTFEKEESERIIKNLSTQSTRSKASCQVSNFNQTGIKSKLSSEKQVDTSNDETVLTVFSSSKEYVPRGVTPSQSTKIVSPFVVTKNKHSRSKMKPLPINFTPRSCVTPCPKVPLNCTGRSSDDDIRPSKKRTVPIKTLRATKRYRGRFGHVHGLIMSDDMDYSFPSCQFEC